MKQEVLKKAVGITAEIVNSKFEELDPIVFVNQLALNQLQSILSYYAVESMMKGPSLHGWSRGYTHL